MADFASYYLEHVLTLWNNVVEFFRTVFSAFGKAFWTDIGDYFDKLAYASKDFDFLGWACLILVTIVNLTLIFFILFRLYLLLRRYILFRSQEVQKDMLIEEVANMKSQLEKMEDEKARILGLKLGSDIGMDLTKKDKELPALLGDKVEDKPVATGISRFTKLIDIDMKYTANPLVTRMTEDDNISLSQLVDRFVNFSASQLRLYYSKDVIRRFIAGLAASKVIILEGISGTGKTSLPYAMGKFFNNDAKITSVQPSWRDRAELIGYLNEFTKKFNETDFLAFLYEVTMRDDISLIIIDEMNLARIEYYFAEFLSIMEMPDTTEWKIEIVPSSTPDDPVNIINGKLLVPQNVWFVGTANQDDSTFTVTDKVYDRAVALELNSKADYFDAPLTQGVNWSYDYLDMLFKHNIKNQPLSEQLKAHLVTIDEFIRDKFRISFGNRILKQISLFVPVYVACGGTEVEAFDFMLQSKVLRKLAALNLPFLTKQLSDLIALLEKIFGKNNMPISTEYLKRLQRMT